MLAQLQSAEVLITGGTGSLGKMLVHKLLKRPDVRGIRVYSRDELKQWEMKQEIAAINTTNKPVGFLIGDVRDLKRLTLACRGTDVIIHAAALKQVPTCEDNPLEAIETNVIGAKNILYSALENKVKKVMYVSSDKAVYPINLYGATKMCAEKLMIQGNAYSGAKEPFFSVCRYGNVLGSRGSIVPLFHKQYSENKSVTVTHLSMTRFWISLSDAADFILRGIEDMKGGEIFVPKMPSAKVVDIVSAVCPKDVSILEIGIRSGEKMHETLITLEESSGAKEEPARFVIYDRPLPGLRFVYSSDRNHDWLGPIQIGQMLEG